MNYDYKYHLTSLSLLFIFIFLPGCCDDPRQVGVILFTEKELKVNPYIKGEEIRFINESDSVITYWNNSREILQDNWSECYNCDNDFGCCCRDYYLVECLDKTQLGSNYLNSEFVIKILKNYGDPYYYYNRSEVCDNDSYFEYNTYFNEPELRISWRKPKDDLNYIYYYFEPLPINNIIEYAKNKNWYRQTLQLRTKIFKDVFTLPEVNNDTTRLEADTVYYTIQNGIIGFKRTNGTLWTLD